MKKHFKNFSFQNRPPKITNKLAPYGTDGWLFTTDVSANFKVTWQKLRQISKIRHNKNL